MKLVVEIEFDEPEPGEFPSFPTVCTATVNGEKRERQLSTLGGSAENYWFLLEEEVEDYNLALTESLY